MEPDLDVRPSPIAGQWYPADPNRLAIQVDRYIREANPPALPGQVLAVVVPHAGHPYSGPVAGYAFKMLQGLTPDVVVVASPMHYPYYEPLLTSAHEAYGTPLGVIPVAKEALQELNQYLSETLGFGLRAVERDPEHSLEIELPFLQRALKTPFSLLPIMVRDQGQTVAEGLGHSLARLIREGQALKNRSALLVASTDLSHFYPQHVAQGLDSEMLRQVAALDPAGVIRVEEQGKGFACGSGALAAILWAAKDLGANRAEVLRYATSGEVTGDFERVVGYGAAAIVRE